MPAMQIGLIARLAGAMYDQRYLSYIDHPLTDPFSQRIFQTACGYNDANGLRRGPLPSVAVTTGRVMIQGMSSGV
jgi:hypothetical protein